MLVCRAGHLGMMNRRQSFPLPNRLRHRHSSKRLALLAFFVRKARLLSLHSQCKRAGNAFANPTRSASKTKSKVDKDSKIKPIYWCSECIAFSNKLQSIFKEAPELRSAYATVGKDALLHEYKQKNLQAIKAALVQALDSETSVPNETTFKGNGQWLDDHGEIPIEACPSAVNPRESEIVHAPDAWLYAL